MIDVVSVEAVEGLRERKRRMTRATIAREALELFARQGFAETTIPEIAEAADVSPRTVSAYFPHKEGLAFPDSEEAFDRLAARLHDRGPGETTAEALRDWLDAWLAEAPHDDQLAMRRRVIDAEETLRAYEQRHLMRAHALLAEALARDLGLPVDALEPQMAAAATVTIFTQLGDRLEGDVDDDAQRAAALELVDRALVFIAGGVAALRES
jgi:AcrR family transcriptional regulator